MKISSLSCRIQKPHLEIDKNESHSVTKKTKKKHTYLITYMKKWESFLMLSVKSLKSSGFEKNSL